MKPILVLVDFSDATPAVLETAAELANGLGHELVVLHVADSSGGTPDDSDDVTVPATAQDADAAIAEGRHLREARRKLLIIEMELKRRGLRATTLLVPTAGSRQGPVALILQQIDAVSPAFVVVGSHEHGRLYQLLVGGGVAQKVLREARWPVMIVPAVRSPVTLAARAHS
jgi:nucleotide-binding universal stress UspA family protein